MLFVRTFRLLPLLFLVAALSAGPVRAQEKGNNNAGNLLSKFKKTKPGPRLTVSNLTDASVYIGIAEVLDTVSGMSRSFALYELFRDRPILRNGEALVPVMIDYPFLAPYAISGVIGSDGTFLKFYEKGKKVAEHTLKGDDWEAIWSKTSAWLGGQALVLGKKDKVAVDEGSSFDFPRHTSITEMMPGSEMTIKVPGFRLITSTKYFILESWFKNAPDKPYEYLREVYGHYRTFKEDALYFFDSGDVPDDAKRAARPFVFPLYRTPRPALQYFHAIKLFDDEKDWGAAYQAGMAVLSTSDDIFVGPQEQALIREQAFLRLAEIQLRISPARKQTESLFLFASKLNGIYSKDTLAVSESKRYYTALDPLKKQLKTTSEMAYKIKSTRFQGIMSAAGAFAGGLGSSIGGASQAATQPYLNLMQSTLNQTLSTTSTMQNKINDLFKGMDRNVNAKSFLAGQELEADFGKPLVAAEVYYHLSRHPELMKDPLGEYSADKPQLYKLLREFYLGKKPAAVLPKIYEQFVFIEQAVLNYEGRNKPIPSSVLEKF